MKMRFRLSKYIAYQMNVRLLLISLCFSIATFVVYVWFFDILAPFIPEGSVRSSYGVLFLCQSSS